ncbi:LptA/OstA family protein [Allorhizobium borbori]|uniref:Lipopolysaccharide export system protein LptA n=1 Tax=Allorhizobium borbori TaxID=485907 RepID=A0A7W6JY17_9HYPH|nr:LptA/OstA family protein [Allorhizobium borbori]MBB4101622.1 lipopolysaccharide export system protein LptA [Allorhizobium borbori]PZU21825.1 MAG: hypothetical protein DI589_13010 [Shinella sp.]
MIEFSPIKDRKTAAFLTGLAIAAVCLPQIALAQSTTTKGNLKLSNDQPIQIESDQLEVKDKEAKAIFTGNVKVVQGTTTMQSGNMTVYYKSGEGTSISSGSTDIKSIDMGGKVFLSSGTQQATADAGRFDMDTQTFVLTGDKVVLSEGQNVFVGCKLTVHMDSGEAKLDACGGRVSIQLDPSSQKKP